MEKFRTSQAVSEPDRIDVYVACPYTRAGICRRIRNVLAATHYAAHLAKLGLVVYSPLTHSAIMHIVCHLPAHFGFWRESSLRMVRLSRSVHVLTVPDWRESFGVRAEMYEALKCHIPIILVKPVSKRHYAQRRLDEEIANELIRLHRPEENNNIGLIITEP